MSDENKPRFMLVGFSQYSASGGKGDVVGYFNSMNEAISAAKNCNDRFKEDFYEILNFDTCEWMDVEL